MKINNSIGVRNKAKEYVINAFIKINIEKNIKLKESFPTFKTVKIIELLEEKNKQE